MPPENEIELRIFTAIEAERKERRSDISAIHDRIDRLPDEIIKRLPKMDENASWVRQSVGLTLAVITLLGFFITILVGQINPISFQIKTTNESILQESISRKAHAAIKGHPGILEEVATLKQKFAEVETQFRGLDTLVHRIESAADQKIFSLDEKLQIEFGSVGTELERLRASVDQSNLRYSEQSRLDLPEIKVLKEQVRMLQKK